MIKTRKIFLISSLILLVLFSNNFTSVSATDSFTFNQYIVSGITLDWKVTTCIIELRPSPEYYNEFKKGDIFRLELIADPPEEANWTFRPPLVNYNEWTKYYKNGNEIDYGDMGLIAVVFDLGMILPLTYTHENETISYFQWLYDYLDGATNLTQTLGEQYYEYTQFFEHVSLGAYTHYYKYNIETGILAEYREIVDAEVRDKIYEFAIVSQESDVTDVYFLSPMGLLLVGVLIIKLRKTKRK